MPSPAFSFCTIVNAAKNSLSADGRSIDTKKFADLLNVMSGSADNTQEYATKLDAFDGVSTPGSYILRDGESVAEAARAFYVAKISSKAPELSTCGEEKPAPLKKWDFKDLDKGKDSGSFREMMKEIVSNSYDFLLKKYNDNEDKYYDEKELANFLNAEIDLQNTNNQAVMDGIIADSKDSEGKVLIDKLSNNLTRYVLENGGTNRLNNYFKNSDRLFNREKEKFKVKKEDLEKFLGKVDKKSISAFEFKDFFKNPISVQEKIIYEKMLMHDANADGVFNKVTGLDKGIDELADYLSKNKIVLTPEMKTIISKATNSNGDIDIKIFAKELAMFNEKPAKKSLDTDRLKLETGIDY